MMVRDWLLVVVGEATSASAGADGDVGWTAATVPVDVATVVEVDFVLGGIGGMGDGLELGVGVGKVYVALLTSD